MTPWEQRVFMAPRVDTLSWWHSWLLDPGWLSQHCVWYSSSFSSELSCHDKTSQYHLVLLPTLFAGTFYNCHNAQSYSKTWILNVEFYSIEKLDCWIWIYRKYKTKSFSCVLCLYLSSYLSGSEVSTDWFDVGGLKLDMISFQFQTSISVIEMSFATQDNLSNLQKRTGWPILTRDWFPEL